MSIPGYIWVLSDYRWCVTLNLELIMETGVVSEKEGDPNQNLEGNIA